MSKNVYLESKPRFEILDGLRGVAALTVMVFHLFETYSGGWTEQIVNHGYLAVDFFFVLSGFVIGYAYDDRWDRMSLGNFFRRRLIRLHPMVVMGSIIGLLLFYFGVTAFPMIAEIPVWKVLLMAVLGCLLIPSHGSMDIRGWGEYYPLNGPAWTLLMEYIGNMLYALVFRYLPKFALGICVALFAVLTIDLCLDINMFGLLTESRQAYSPIGGWSMTAEQIYIGFARLLYPFFMGLLLSRLGARIKIQKGGFWICALIVLVVLCMPYMGNGDSKLGDGIYNLIIILAVFPLIVTMGAGSTLSGQKTSKLCKFLGEISYPLYITHYPLIYAQMSFAQLLSEMGASQGAHILMSVGVGIAAIAMAWASYKLWDLPIREKLTNKLRSRYAAKS